MSPYIYIGIHLIYLWIFHSLRTTFCTVCYLQTEVLSENLQLITELQSFVSALLWWVRNCRDRLECWWEKYYDCEGTGENSCVLSSYDKFTGGYANLGGPIVPKMKIHELLQFPWAAWCEQSLHKAQRKNASISYIYPKSTETRTWQAQSSTLHCDM